MSSVSGTPPLIVDGVDELIGLAGHSLGTGDWVVLDQPVLDAFADVTGDDHWSHVDSERAKVSPAGQTIAPGLLTLSLHPSQFYKMVEFRGFRGLYNYGYDRVRFPAHVLSGTRVRMSASFGDVNRTTEGAKATVRFVFESDSADKPVCVADYLQYFEV